MTSLHHFDNKRDAATLLFVHGTLMDHTLWAPQIKAFEDTHRVITVDLPSFGRSPGTGNEQFTDHGEALRDLIESLGLKDVTLVGWSLGGSVAMAMAYTCPTVLSRMVLVDSSPQIVTDEHFSHALEPEAVNGIIDLFAQDFPGACDMFAQACAPECALSQTLLHRVIARTDQAVAVSALKNSAKQKLTSHLKDMTIDTHVICGKEDTLCPPVVSAFLADHIPGCQSQPQLIDNAGHCPFMTRPEAFNHALRRIVC
ncbi:MAG: alpha/beta hydrolase [Pseudomonadota bacterium]